MPPFIMLRYTICARANVKLYTLINPGSIHIGTSGWSYQHWKKIFYPDNLPQAEWLQFYSNRFNTTEINTSFYHLPSAEKIGGWKQKVPAGFFFCPKMSRYLTHMKKLNDAREVMLPFFDAFTILKRRLGPVLVQLPPSLKFNDEKAEIFYKVCKKHFPYYRFAMEVRHKSWLADESIALMKKYKMTFVISQSGAGFPYGQFVTAPDVYIRFHGPGALYASGYSEHQLQEFYKQMMEWKKAGHHVWVYFNNDINGYAFKNALRLKVISE